MASAVKFMANRMEEIENSFLTIFFEAATKMAQSTESKLFFIMESSDGIRKIGGTSDLKRVFYAGRLLPRNSDVTIGVDASMGRKQTVAPDDTNPNSLGQKPRKRRGKFEPIIAKRSRKSLENIWNDDHIKDLDIIKVEGHEDEEVVEEEEEEYGQEMEEEEHEVEDEDFEVEDQPVGDCGIEEEDDINIPSQWEMPSSRKDYKKGDIGGRLYVGYAECNQHCYQKLLC